MAGENDCFLGYLSSQGRRNGSPVGLCDRFIWWKPMRFKVQLQALENPVIISAFGSRGIFINRRQRCKKMLV
jgi:hypothetical protein